MSNYCNANDKDCNLIYNLYRNINSNLEDQNEKLDAQYKKVGEIYSTDYQKSNYQHENVTYYRFMNNILFVVYYILVFFVIFKVVPSNMLRAVKGLVIGMFLLYPFVIQYVEIILYGILKYIHALITGTVYIPPEY